MKQSNPNFITGAESREVTARNILTSKNYGKDVEDADKLSREQRRKAKRNTRKPSKRKPKGIVGTRVEKIEE
jgi:hypothetical protein